MYPLQILSTMAAHDPHVSSTDAAKDEEHYREGCPPYSRFIAEIVYNYQRQHSNAA
jgi:hypothetical protein